MKNTIAKEILDWGMHIAIAVVIGLLIVTFVGQRTIVYGQSMESTLHEKDQLIIEKITPKLGKLEHGDIVTANVPEFLEDGRENIVKRVIGLEGDTVEIRQGKVYVNGNALQEDYVKGGRTTPFKAEYAKITVPAGHVYLMGDNRMVSKDSRSIGPVEMSKISGRVIVRFYPLDQIGKIK